MGIEFVNTEYRVCSCGCGQRFPVYIGNLDYGDDNFVIFQVAHLRHQDSGPNVWLQLRTGSWSDDDSRDCWATIHLWVNDGQVITRITDPEESPFWQSRTDDFRYLTREDVLGQKGAKEWAIARRLELEAQHQATADFINERNGDTDRA